jgi:hypothetical protein
MSETQASSTTQVCDTDIAIKGQIEKQNSKLFVVDVPESGGTCQPTTNEVSAKPPSTCRTPNDYDHDSDSSVPVAGTSIGDVSASVATGHGGGAVMSTLSIMTTDLNASYDKSPPSNVSSGLPISPSAHSLDPAAARALRLDPTSPQKDLPPPLDGSPAKGFVASRRATFSKTLSVTNMVCQIDGVNADVNSVGIIAIGDVSTPKPQAAPTFGTINDLLFEEPTTFQHVATNNPHIPKEKIPLPPEESPSKGVVASRIKSFTRHSSVPNLSHNSIADGAGGAPTPSKAVEPPLTLDTTAASAGEKLAEVTTTFTLSLNAPSQVHLNTDTTNAPTPEEPMSPPPPLDGSPSKGFVASRRMSFTKHNSVPNLAPILKDRSGSFYQKVVDDNKQGARWSLTSTASTDYNAVETEEDNEVVEENEAVEEEEEEGEVAQEVAEGEGEGGTAFANDDDDKVDVDEDVIDEKEREEVAGEEEEGLMAEDSATNALAIAKPEAPTEESKEVWKASTHLSTVQVQPEGGCCRCM